MNILGLYSHNLLFRSPSNEAAAFPLSHSCVQMSESLPVFQSKAPILTMACRQPDHEKKNRFYLSLDFKDTFPHSSLQTNIDDD